MNTWNAKTYAQFLDLRTQPARDLLSAIPSSLQPSTVYDLGCGPGNSTLLLKERWPHAKVIGIDNSPDMLQAARADYPDITFIQEDIAQFAPVEKIDCLFANASLQWLNEHAVLFPKLLYFISPGGALAIQMPNNFHSPTHQVTIHLLENHPTWRLFLNRLRYGALTQPMYQLNWYYDLLIKAGAHSLRLWETEYVQEMPDYQGIFDWVKGTGLRPVLSAMDKKMQIEFANAYVKAISGYYPLQANNKILLPFKRIFMLGYK